MHTATQAEMERCEALADELALEFDRLMDADCGPGDWCPSPAAIAAMQAEAELCGWLWVARHGLTVKKPLCDEIANIRTKLTSYKMPIPNAIRAAGGAQGDTTDHGGPG